MLLGASHSRKIMVHGLRVVLNVCLADVSKARPLMLLGASDKTYFCDTINLLDLYILIHHFLCLSFASHLHPVAERLGRA